MEDDVLSMINEEPTEESVDVDIKDMIDAEAGGQPSDQDEPAPTDEQVDEPADDTPDGEPEPEEPSNETDNPSEPEADQLDVAKYFEGYSSQDEVKSALERAKQFTPEVEQELLTLRERNKQVETLQSEVKSLKERQPFNDVKFYQLDKLSKEDPDKAAILTRYQFGDNSAESVIKLKMMLENPGIAEKNPDFFQQTLEKTYDDFYNGVEGDKDYEYAKTKMEVDALAARKVLDGELSKIEVPSVKTEEQQKAEMAQFFRDWTPSFAKVKEVLSKIDIPIQDKENAEKTNVYMSFDIPKEDLNMVYEVAANHIANSRITPTPENIKQAVDVAAATYLYTNRAKIFTKVVNNALAEAGGKTIKTVTNSAKRGADVHVGKSQTVKEAADLIFDELGGNQY